MPGLVGVDLRQVTGERLANKHMRHFHAPHESGREVLLFEETIDSRVELPLDFDVCGRGTVTNVVLLPEKVTDHIIGHCDQCIFDDQIL